jgi:REP element-mobilizing transposase RayT
MQLKLNLNRGRHGGRRAKCGKKRQHSKGVSHRTREKIESRTPLHINFRYNKIIRNKETLKLLKRSIANARVHGLRILHFSFQSNHIHLIVEANDNKTLTKCMRSLTITFAKGLRCGRIQIERYHLHALRTVRESQNAIHYVLFNQQKHEKGIYSTINEYSSVLSFENGLELVRKFAIRNKMILKIERGQWVPDIPSSWLARKGMWELLK